MLGLASRLGAAVVETAAAPAPEGVSSSLAVGLGAVLVVFGGGLVGLGVGLCDRLRVKFGVAGVGPSVELDVACGGPPSSSNAVSEAFWDPCVGLDVKFDVGLGVVVVVSKLGDAGVGRGVVVDSNAQGLERRLQMPSGGQASYRLQSG